MELQIDVTVPEFVTTIKVTQDISDSIIEGYEEVDILVPETEHEVKINLKDLCEDDLIDFVQKQTFSTLVDNDILKELEDLEDTYKELEDCFKDLCFNNIRKQEVIAKAINYIRK